MRARARNYLLAQPSLAREFSTYLCANTALRLALSYESAPSFEVRICYVLWRQRGVNLLLRTRESSTSRSQLQLLSCELSCEQFKVVAHHT
eukprot:1257078-Pleurochrysis_carterae.AAC.3